MLNADEITLATEHNKVSQEDTNRLLNIEFQKWNLKIIKCENLIIQKNNELKQIDIAKTFKSSQGISQDPDYDYDLDKKSYLEIIVSKIYNILKNIFAPLFRKRNTIYVDFKKSPIDARYLERIDSVRQLESDISNTEILNNSIAEIETKRNFYAFKFALNYSQYSRNGNLSLQTQNQLNCYFPKAINFLKFYCDPKNLLCDYHLSQEELGKFISSYRFFYDISPNPTFDGVGEIVSEEFEKINSLYLNSLNTTSVKDKISENFSLLNIYANDLREKEDFTVYSVPDYVITCFNEAKVSIHNYLDQGLPIPKDELVTLRNYNFLNRKLSELKLDNSRGFKYDIRISNVANRIKVLVESDRKESINKGQESPQSLKSHNSFATILLPTKLEQDQSISESPFIADDNGLVGNGQNISRVKQMAQQYEINHGDGSKKFDPKLRKIAGEAFDAKFPHASFNQSLGIGVGRVFVESSSLKSRDPKEVSV